jgi:hypothetical protein
VNNCRRGKEAFGEKVSFPLLHLPPTFKNLSKKGIA